MCYSYPMSKLGLNSLVLATILGLHSPFAHGQDWSGVRDVPRWQPCGAPPELRGDWCRAAGDPPMAVRGDGTPDGQTAQGDASGEEGRPVWAVVLILAGFGWACAVSIELLRARRRRRRK
jgi:hypothetical protein